MLDEWDFTPMLSVRHRSSVDWFVSPSSLASSWTRIFPRNSSPPLRRASKAAPTGNGSRGKRPSNSKPSDLRGLHVGPQSPVEGSTVFSMVQAREIVAQPSSPARTCPDRQGAVGIDSHPSHLRTRAADATADAGTDAAQELAVRSAGAAAGLSAAAAAHASALTASPPSAGRHTCSPVAGSVIHSPSAQSTSP